MSGPVTSDVGALLRRYLPILNWGAEYSRQTLTSDRHNHADPAVVRLCAAGTPT